MIRLAIRALLREWIDQGYRMVVHEERLSFVTANFVAKAAGYNLNPDWLRGDWGKGDKATRDLFRSDAFEYEFESMLRLISNVGFKTIELWTTHLEYNDSEEKVRMAKRILDENEISVCSYAGGFGGSEEEIERSFRLADALGAKILAGGLEGRLFPKAYQLCQRYGIRFALENHPGMETPEKLRTIIDKKEDWFGATIDTGWFATYGIDPAEAIRKLGKSVFHVHLKDIREVHKHESCTLGDGVVDIPEVLRSLGEIAYEGYISIEHEPGDHDPVDDIKESLRRLRGWLSNLR